MADQGRRHGFKLGWANILGKIRREAPKKIFALPGFQFAYPGFNNTSGQRPSCDNWSRHYSLPLALRTIHFAYQFVYTIISNYTTLNVQWQQFRNAEFDKCFNRSNKCKDSWPLGSLYISNRKYFWNLLLFTGKPYIHSITPASFTFLSFFYPICPLPVGPLRTRAYWTKANLHAKRHLDPFRHFTRVHHRNGQTDTHVQLVK